MNERKTLLVRALLVPVCIGLVFSMQVQVRAEYYDHHMDVGDYCIQAKNVQITDIQRQLWLEKETLQENILKKSGIIINKFHPSDSTNYWTTYEGGCDVDIHALEEITIQEASKTVQVTFFLKDEKDAKITVDIEVLPDGEDLEETKEINNVKEERTFRDEEEPLPDVGALETEAENNSQREEYQFWGWAFLTSVAAIGFGYSLHSDFKVLRKYNRKKQEIEGGD